MTSDSSKYKVYEENKSNQGIQSGGSRNSYVRWGAQEDISEEVTSEQGQGCSEEPSGESCNAKALRQKEMGAIRTERKLHKHEPRDSILHPANKVFTLQRDVINICTKAEAATHSSAVHSFIHSSISQIIAECLPCKDCLVRQFRDMSPTMGLLT